MAIRSERTIYQLVETHLRDLTSPTTCVELMDIPEIRKEAVAEFGGADKDVRLSTNKMSDVLGFMWRRGLLTRYPAPPSDRSLARYAYSWASDSVERPAKPISPPVRLSQGFDTDDIVVLVEAMKRMTEAIQDVADAIREKE